MVLAGTLATATMVGIVAPAAQAAPRPAGLNLLAAAAHTTPVAGPVGKRGAVAAREAVRITLPTGQQADGYRISIPDSQVASGIVVLWDRYTGTAGGHTLSVGREGAEADQAEAYVRRVEAAIAELAGSADGRALLEGIGRMRPLDVVAGGRKSEFQPGDVNVVFYRGMPADAQEWPDALRKQLREREEADKQLGAEAGEGLADGLRRSAVVTEPAANAVDRVRASNGDGSEGMIGMPDEEKVFFGYQPDRKLIAMREPQMVAHELVHAAHYLQGTLRDGTSSPVQVEYTAAGGSRETATVDIKDEEVATLGGEDARRYLTHVAGEGGSRELRRDPIDKSAKAVAEAAEQAHDEGVKKSLRDVELGRHQTFRIDETRLAEVLGWPARRHYALPGEPVAKAWGITEARVAGEFFTVPSGEKVTNAEAKNAEGLKARLEKTGKTKSSLVRACSRFFGRQSVQCSPDSSPEEVSAETNQRVDEVGEFLKEHPDAQVKLPSADNTAAREKARSEAEAAGKQLEKRLGERAKELCAASGEAACLGKVDWEKVRKELRADAEELVEKKLLAVENVKDIKLDKDFAAALGDASGFYLPYDKTREVVSGHAGEGGDHTGINASKLADKAGKAMWLAGIAQAFAADSSNLDKAAAVTAMMPAVGNLMQLSADAVKQDWTHLGFDAAFVLLEGAEFLGLEAAGPAGWAVMGVELIVDQFINFAKKEAEKGAMLGTMAKQAHDGALRAVSDTSSKGWMAHGGSTTVLQMALAMMQTVEVQRATVKGLARAGGTAAPSGTVPNGTDLRKETWAADKQFADADAKADALATQSLAQIRKAVARRLADQLNKLWDDEKTQKKFVEPYASRYAELEYGDGYTGENSRGSKALACAGRDSSWPNETLCNIWNFKPKPVDAAEVEEILKAMGLPGTAAPQRDTALAGLLTAQGASGQVDAVMPVPGADREYWAFSGGQYVRMRLDDKADGRKLAATLTGKGGPVPVKGNWRSLEALLAVSKTGRIDAAMPVPGADRQLYVFSGDQYTRIRIDDDLKDTVVGGYDKPRSLPDNWPSLEDLFAKSGVQRVDAVQAVPGNNTEYYVFSGSWYTTIRLDDILKDWQMVGSRRIASGWPMLVGESGQDQVQGLIPVPGTDRDFYVFANGGYARANAKTLRLQTPNATASAWVVTRQAQIFWSNGADLPADAKLIAREQGSDEEHSYPARDGKSDYWTAPTVNLWESGKQRVIDVHYRYTHPDGTVEWSPSSTVKFECWPAVCKGIPQYEG